MLRDAALRVISVAMAVPKGKTERLAYVGEFVEEAKASGLVQRVIERAGRTGLQVVPLASPTPKK
jgi:polar amino acid transport system substrate-binding protein